MMPQVDVIVVGAGLAGLMTARRLRSQGRTVLLLEARDRVGGRLCGVELAGAKLDVGGQWLGARQPRLRALAQEVGAAVFPQYHAGTKLLSWAGKLRRFRGEVPWLSPLAMLDLWRLKRFTDRAGKAINPAEPWTAVSAAAWDKQTIEAWKQQFFWSAGGRLFLDIVVRAVLTSEPDDVSLFYFLSYLRSGHGLDSLIGMPAGAQQERFVEGTQALTTPLAAELGTNLRLGEPVQSVRQDANGVRLRTPRGEYHGRFAVLALPPALLGKIQFDPALPPQRAKLVESMPMGKVIKYLIRYDRPFWREVGLSGEAFADEGPCATTFDATTADGKAALVTFSDGQAARDWSLRDAADRQQGVLNQMAAFFGPAALRPLAYAEKDWLAEEWSQGCYAGVMGPGVLTELGPALREPCGRIHWAGTETAREWLGYMEGALESAERVTDEVGSRLAREVSHV